MGATKLVFSIIILVFLIIYHWYRSTSSIYIKSNIDNQYYQVRDTYDKQEIADTLARIKKNIQALTLHMLSSSSGEYKKYIEHLNSKLNQVVISENIYENYYTSYSVNKGEQLVFCMRSRNNGTNNKHDINLIMYVVLHEIAHIACPEYGHGTLFKDIFKYITQNAIDMGLYEPIDFKNHPTEYCGMTITDSIV